MAEEVQDLGRGPDGGQRVCNSLSGNVRRGTVDRLEHGGEFPLRVQVGPGGQAHAAGDGGAQVGEDIAEEVGGDDDLKPLRVFDHEHAGRVHQQGVCLHIRVFPADFGKNLVPEDHGVVERVALADARQRFMLLPGQLVGVADHPLAAMAGEHAVLDDHFVRLAFVQPRAAAGVFALAVLADEGHVDILRLRVLQRAGRAPQQPDRPQVNILVKAFADFQQQPPQGDMVRHAGSAHRAEVDGVELLQLFDAVIIHHLSVLQVEIAAPGELRPFETEAAVERSHRVEHFDPFGDYLRADSVSGNGSHSVRYHAGTS